MWGQLANRPDLCFPVSLLACFQSNPGLAHWKALLHVLGYVKATIDYGIVFSHDQSLIPIGFVDTDYGGCCDTTWFDFGIRLHDGWRTSLLELQASSYHRSLHC